MYKYLEKYHELTFLHGHQFKLVYDFFDKKIFEKSVSNIEIIEENNKIISDDEIKNWEKILEKEEFEKKSYEKNKKEDFSKVKNYLKFMNKQTNNLELYKINKTGNFLKDLGKTLNTIPDK